MHIGKKGKEFLTIEMDYEDAIYLFNCIVAGMQNIPTTDENITRHKSFLNQFKEILDNRENPYM